MLEQKKIQEMNRREYCSYVQRQYSNEPQWVRTRLISKWDQENVKKSVPVTNEAAHRREGHSNGQNSSYQA